MIASLRITAYGRPATLALRDLLGVLQAGDPLRPVTVVVPSNLVGVSARRLLASGEVGPVGRRAGLVNVSFVTPYRLAEMLGEQAVAATGRRPLTTPVLAAAVRAQLAEEPGIFRPVASHPATEAAVVRAYAELSRLRPDTLARLKERGSPRTRGVIGCVEGARARLAGWFDENDLAGTAAREVAAHPEALAPLGAVVLHLPQPVPPGLADLLAAISRHGDMHAVAGLTGVAAADGPVRSVLAALGGDLDGAELPLPPFGSRIVRVSDPDDEVRTALRTVMALAADADDPIRLDRMAIAYPAAEPYARILAESMTGAGIPSNGPGVDTLAHRAAGRLVLALLGAAQGTLGRAEVIALLDAAPLRDDEGVLPVARWDLLSRNAGVVGGLEDWRLKLHRYASELEARAGEIEAATEGEGEPSGHSARLRSDGLETLRIAHFVEGLASSFTEIAGVTSYVHGASALAGLIANLTGP
ncbi:MAG TPA: hypothetical protein VF855_12670, partial [Acidimicrobiales bacterium]